MNLNEFLLLTMTSIFDAEQHSRRTRRTCYSRIQIHVPTQSTAKLVWYLGRAFFSRIVLVVSHNKSSYRAVTQCFYFVLSRNQQISRRRSLLCSISSSCGELLWTFTQRKAEPILVEQKELHSVVGQWWWIGHWASLGFKERLRFAISLVLKVRTNGLFKSNF